MPAGIRFPMVGLPGSAEELRAEVREFLSCEITEGAFSPRCDSWLGEYSPEFSRKLGERGWLGMTWPKRYGGHERSTLKRFVVTEELLAAGAPVASHWIANRQSGTSRARPATTLRSTGCARPGTRLPLRGMFPVAREAKGQQAVRRKLWAEVLARVPVCVIVRPGDDRETSAGDRKE